MAQTRARTIPGNDVGVSVVRTGRRAPFEGIGRYHQGAAAKDRGAATSHQRTQILPRRSECSRRSRDSRYVHAREPAQATGHRGYDAKLTGIFGGSAMTNPYISLIVNTFFYGSNLSQKELDARTVPGFTNVPVGVNKGFTLESAELFIFAPVDPYFNLYANIPVTEDGAELEEAYFVTSSLPAGLQVKGGKFKSGFGRINAQHPHAWDFVDIPLNYRALIGQEGWADTGVQVTYLPSLPVYTQFGMEVLQGKNDLLFNPDGTTPYAFTAFVKSSLDFGESSTLLFGPSFATGKARITTVADDTFFSGT
jgi:hypothetical protein